MPGIKKFRIIQYFFYFTTNGLTIPKSILYFRAVAVTKTLRFFKLFKEIDHIIGVEISIVIPAISSVFATLTILKDSAISESFSSATFS